jgi:hypothetical protein
MEIMNDKEKLILGRLVKIAGNQQRILQKLAQGVDPAGEADKALSDFIKFQLTSWGMPMEIAANERHIAKRGSHSKDYNVDVTLTLQDKTKKEKAEDPARGFGAFLTKRFAEAQANPQSPLYGYTATFNVMVN